ncbi:hypothetical protein M0R45_028604 [Rubus argutus]|uniref:Uncharacterized protein n=1 Tax=Rubus argutus TaxID=59490 RepID=A0AAW1W8A7_RUBAR
MSGRVSVLDSMFLDVQQKIKNEERLGNAPTTVYYASERVKDHLEEYGHENNNDNSLTFGTIIGGRDIAGFGLYEAFLSGKVARKSACNYTALGSSNRACWRQMDSISA